MQRVPPTWREWGQIRACNEAVVRGFPQQTLAIDGDALMTCLRVNAACVLAGLFCLVVAGCASPGYRYAGGESIGSPTLVDARGAASISPDAHGTHSPRLVSQGKLQYPEWATLQAACGTVTVEASIGTDGRPTHIHVVSQRFDKKFVADENTGKLYPIAPFYDQPAINFVLGSRFQPGTVDGVATEMPIKIAITFGNSLDGSCRKTATY